jgi:DNA-binding NtrC family response regulator
MRIQDVGKEVFFELWKFHSIYPHEILTSFFRKKILKITGGNRAKAAYLLGISRKTLWEKINMYNLDA